MRKYLVSALILGLAGPIGYLAWNSTNSRAIAQVGASVDASSAGRTAPRAAPSAGSTDDPFGDQPKAPAAAAPASAAPTQPAPQVQPTQQGQQGQRVVGGQPAHSLQSFVVLPAELAMVPEDPAITGISVSAAESKIEAELHAMTEINVKDTPLRNVMEHLSAKHKINIVLDLPALREAGVEPDALVTENVSGISLRSALHLLLDELQLKYVIHNEVLLITSPTKAESDDFMTTMLYPVKDLVLERNEQGGIEADFSSLTDTITETVATKTWQDNGGQGTLSQFLARGHCLLVVSQTQDVHEQIADLLAALRKAGGPSGRPASDLLLPTRATRYAPPSPGMMGGGMGGMGNGAIGAPLPQAAPAPGAGAPPSTPDRKPDTQPKPSGQDSKIDDPFGQ